MADETATQPALDDSRIENVEIQKEVQRSYIDYAMSVIVGRALPDVRDGLKPVHQRILWGMLQLGVRPGQSYRKCAKVVGEVMGTYHPHGDSAIYDALARMAQTFTMRYPLVDGKGNFGSLDGDPPGAMRYCVTGDTRVWTTTGSRRISELAELAPNSEADIETKVLDKEGIPVLATKLFHSGTHPTIRIGTREGYELTGTRNHPVLCLENVLGVPMLLWKLLSEVTPGTFVAMSRPEPEDSLLDDLDRQALKWGITTDKVPFLADYIRSDCGSRWVDKDWLNRHNIDRIAHWESLGDEILSRIASDEVKRVIEPLVSGRYYFAEVAGIEDGGFHPVYSIRVDSHDHSFVTNGFVSHNTECRLHPLAMELLADIDEDTVEFRPNYDGSAREPVVLPARFPNLLVNGSTGIAVGMSTNIPPHNLGEVIDAVVAMIDDPEIKPPELMKLVKGPDFPLGGIILGREGIRDAYTTGRGSVKVRAKCEVEETKQGRQRIVVTELPYMVSGDRVLLKVADLVKAGKMQGISDLRNESNRQGIRLVIELKRDAIPQVVLNNLYKHTQLQDSFGIIMLALVDGVPKTLSLDEVIRHYIDHQVDVVTRRTKYRLRKAEERMHVLEGLLIALRNLDAVIKLIRESKSAEDAREKLMKRYKLTEIQANAILDMQLRRLAALERQKIREEATELAKTIKELQSILKSPQKLRKVIKDELAEIRKKFADARRTTITAAEADFDIEDLIPDEEVILTNTRSGYIKRTKAGVYKTQGRGGRGIIGANPKEGDIVDRMLSTTNHAYILVFSSRGKVYRVKAHEIPEKDRTARGTSIRNILPFTSEEQVAALIDTRDFETHKYLVIATKKGIIKKTAFGAYDTSRRDGIIALNLRKDDEVVQVRATSGEDELIMVSRKGMSIRFAETDVRPMGRTAGGVIGMRLSGEDEVVSFDVVDQNGELLIITDAGYGKRTLLERYPTQKRGGKGVKTAKLTGKRGSIQGAGVVRVGHEVFLIASDGQVIRMTVRDISRQGRDTTGVRVMRFDAGTQVAAMAPVVIEE